MDEAGQANARKLLKLCEDGGRPKLGVGEVLVHGGFVPLAR
jgi:hypothetical protein